MLIVADGGDAVRVEHLATLDDLWHIPVGPELDDIGYEFARGVIVRAFSMR